MEVRKRVLRIVTTYCGKYNLDPHEASSIHLKLMLKVIELLSSITLEDDRRVKDKLLEASAR